MSERHVTVYVIDDEERGAARLHLKEISEDGEAYIVGITDDAGVQALEDADLVVEDVDVAADRDQVQRRGAQQRLPGFGATTPPDLEPGQRGTFVVHVNTPLSEDGFGTLFADDAQPIERVGAYSWTVNTTLEGAQRLGSLSFVDDVSRDATGVADETYKGGETTLLFDLVLDGTLAANELVELLQGYGVEVVAATSTRIRVRVAADSPIVADPVAVPGVAWAAEGFAAKLHSDRVRSLVGVDALVASAVTGGTLDGAGELIAVLDSGVDPDHPDFGGRLHPAVHLDDRLDNTDVAGHGTHVAGVIAGDGSASNGTWRGVAPGAALLPLHAADESGALAGLPLSVGQWMAAAYDAGARIMNNSWGVDRALAEYTADCYEIDQFVWDHPDFVVVFSAGNECTDRDREFVTGLGYSVSPPGTAKNVLTVGASRSNRSSGGGADDTWGRAYPMNVSKGPIATEPIGGDPERLAPFSGRGPCSDRRLKPDLVAPGTGVCSARSKGAPDASFRAVDANTAYAYLDGTSIAAPAVAGCCALVRQWYRRQDVDPSAALVKATIVNGARWLTGSDAAPTLDDGPNFEQGFGRLAVMDSIPTATTWQLHFVDTWKLDGRGFTRTNTGATWSVEVTDEQPLRICLAYTDRPGRGVQADLNLYVKAPSGKKLLANAAVPDRGNHQLDKDNAVEVVRVERPERGRWSLRVVCSALTDRQSTQHYALVVTGALTSKLRYDGV